VAILIATQLGVVISTTHTVTSAIVGVGATRRLSAVRWGVARQIVWAWVPTIPPPPQSAPAPAGSSPSWRELKGDCRRFDTPIGIQHATEVPSLMARLAVVLLALATTTGSLRLCDGWKATPEARMDCCARGVACPMRERGAHGHHEAHKVTQAAADTCCAVSSHDGATASVPYVLPSLAFASPRRAALEDRPALVRHVRGDESPPTDDVPRHLRLSVFLL